MVTPLYAPFLSIYLLFSSLCSGEELFVLESEHSDEQNGEWIWVLSSTHLIQGLITYNEDIWQTLIFQEQRYFMMRKRLMTWMILDRNSMVWPILTEHLRMGYRLLRELLNCIRPPEIQPCVCSAFKACSDLLFRLTAKHTWTSLSAKPLKQCQVGWELWWTTLFS